MSCNSMFLLMFAYLWETLGYIDTKGWITSSVNIALSCSGGSGMLSASFNHLQWYADTHFYSGPSLACAMNSASNSAWPRTARLSTTSSAVTLSLQASTPAHPRWKYKTICNLWRQSNNAKKILTLNPLINLLSYICTYTCFWTAKFMARESNTECKVVKNLVSM